jgi:endoribonuclease Dicer
LTIISAADEMILDVEFDCSKAVDMGYISPKLLELIKLFETFGYATMNSL